MKRVLLLLPLAVLALSGCANVRVRKVDVDKRLAGADHHVKGFRYYLNRPYLVVSRRVPVSATYLPVTLASYRSADKETLVLVSQVPEPDGRHLVFNLKGELQPGVPYESATLLKQIGNLDTPGKGVFKDVTAYQKALKDRAPAHFKKYRMDHKLDAAIEDDFNQFIKATVDKDNELKKAVVDVGKGERDMQKAASEALTQAAKRVAQAVDKKLTAVPEKTPTFEKEHADGVAGEALELLVKQAALPEKKGETSPAATFALSAKTDDKKAGDGQPSDPGGTPESPFQVAFLPDFEEQYAIDNTNFLAKTHYKYVFRNGTELVSMAGSYDATDIPLKIIETIGKLIDVAGNLAKARLSAGAARSGAFTMDASASRFWIRTEQAIEPGVYRIQKSWERAAAIPADAINDAQLPGMFGDIGLPIVTTISVIDTSEHP